MFGAKSSGKPSAQNRTSAGSRADAPVTGAMCSIGAVVVGLVAFAVAF
jgi:hypothetical protein